MKHHLKLLGLTIVAILAGFLGAFAISFFPGKELLISAILFIVAAVLAWRANEVLDDKIQEQYAERFKDNPDVVETKEPK